MFGFVTANWKELDASQRERYGAVYCGICRSIHSRASGLARVTLSYDMAFLALLHMSLYEPDSPAMYPTARNMPSGVSGGAWTAIPV